jgi:hypothetical protein
MVEALHHHRLVGGLDAGGQRVDECHDQGADDLITDLAQALP